MKKKAAFISIYILMALFFLSGCFGKTKLDSAFNEDELISDAESIIDAVHINGLETVAKERMREDYLEKYPLESTSEDFENMRASMGEFFSYTQTTVIGKSSPDEKEEPFAVVAVTATYEEGELFFTITYDTDMNLISFFVKK